MKLLHQKHVVPSTEPPVPVTAVYTDGGYNAQKTVGAWAFLAHLPDNTCIQRVSGGIATSSNNRMELLAVLGALLELEIGPRIVIHTDSMYVIYGCTEWWPKWVKNGWKASTGEPVKNSDIWKQLIALCDLHDVRFVHVKGHSGHPENEMVDALCTKKMKHCLANKIAGPLQFSSAPVGHEA
jgi:ribonuclease HI